jgi:hypothetical protein
MSYLETKSYKTPAGYLSERRFYECTQYAVCPLKSKCTQANGNRRIQVSFVPYKKDGREFTRPSKVLYVREGMN